MIGVFDSGAGGLTALSEIRARMPSADICFYADRKNAPYGTKSRRELIRLVTRDIAKLRAAGANKILMACCTASTVYDFLPTKMQEISCPIIAPTAAEAARVTRLGKIGVIATEATVASGAFASELSKFREVKSVFELATQALVSLVESGVTDGNTRPTERDILFRMLLPMRQKNIDTLILGCTHFSHLEREIGGCLPGVRLVSASKEGSLEIMKSLNTYGTGKTVYL